MAAHPAEQGLPSQPNRNLTMAKTTSETVRDYWLTPRDKTEARRYHDDLHEGWKERRRESRKLEKERQGAITYGPATK